MINGKQMTVTWHVDGLKISHMESNEQSNRMIVHRGKVHNSPKVLKIGMIKCIKKIHEEFPEEIKSVAATPVAEHIFEILEDNKDKLLLEEQALAFHCTTAQLLFLSVCARPDIQTPVSFLCTRTRAPDEDDWRKLKRIL
eukprot:12493498-Ditylum_brightwellii.AAC.1